MRQRQFHRKQQHGSLLASVAAAPGVVLGLIAVSAAGIMSADDLLLSLSDTAQACNINIETGERIFHVPGQEYYSATKISPQYGERWFCSEAEAWAAGWRKARN